MKDSIRQGDRLAVLASPAFVLALLALLGNDFLLKDLLHDWFTGKLSDFAGLFVFSSLLLILLPGRPRAVLVGVAACFTWWKSPLSQPLIDSWNMHLPLHLHRVVDYSDLLAFVVLPPAMLNFRRWQERRASRFLVYPLGCLALLGTMATSAVIPTVNGDMRVDSTAGADGDETMRLYTAIDTYATNHGMTLVAAESIGAQRVYSDGKQRLYVNFDPDDHRLYYVVGYASSPAERAELNKKFALDVRSIDSGIDVQAKTQSDFIRLPASTQFEVDFPAHHFTFSCSGNSGTDNPDVRAALAIIDEFARDRHLEEATDSDRATGSSCLDDTRRHYLGGRVIGAFAKDHSLHLDVYTWFGLRGTVMQVNMDACCDMQAPVFDMSEELHRRFSGQAWQDLDVDLGSLGEWGKPKAQ